MQPAIVTLQELAMRIFLCLGFVLAASVAHAGSHSMSGGHSSSSASHGSHSSSFSSVGHSAITSRYVPYPDSDTYITVIRPGSYRGTGSGGYHPMGH
jgi:uncharacterized membrane protein